MLSEDSAPRRESVLDEVVVEFEHSGVCFLDSIVCQDEGGQLEKVKDHLDRNGEHCSCDLFAFDIV